MDVMATGWLRQVIGPVSLWFVKGDMRCDGYNGQYRGVCTVVTLPSNLQVTSTTSNGVTVWSLAQ